MRIYVASSWRNERQQEVVKGLRTAGHEVYDFRNPKGDDHGFAWAEIDPDWQSWDAEQFRAALKQHPTASRGFSNDYEAMCWADVCVLVLPCGKSAHLELGWAVGTGKRALILLDDEPEPELMYLMVNAMVTSFDELLRELEK